MPPAKPVSQCPQGGSSQPPELSALPGAVRRLLLTKAGAVSLPLHSQGPAAPWSTWQEFTVPRQSGPPPPTEGRAGPE